LVLIATFELVFFNFYIINYENNSLISLTTQLIQPMLDSCSNLKNMSKIIVDDFINIFINQTIINNNANSDLISRNINNSNLTFLSLVYYTGVLCMFFFLLLINTFLRKKIDYMMIFIDNVIMIVILGVYEYIFFENIIFKYSTMGPNELIKNVINQLLNKC
jgi:hypothetical protein